MKSTEIIKSVKKIYGIDKAFLTDRSEKNKRLVEKFKQLEIDVNWRVKK